VFLYIAERKYYYLILSYLILSYLILSYVRFPDGNLLETGRKPVGNRMVFQ